jgi:hypothetical protein
VFYAGVAITVNGHRIGVFSVCDVVAREFDALSQAKLLRIGKLLSMVLTKRRNKMLLRESMANSQSLTVNTSSYTFGQPEKRILPGDTPLFQSVEPHNCDSNVETNIYNSGFMNFSLFRLGSNSQNNKHVAAGVNNGSSRNSVSNGKLGSIHNSVSGQQPNLVGGINSKKISQQGPHVKTYLSSSQFSVDKQTRPQSQRIPAESSKTVVNEGSEANNEIVTEVDIPTARDVDASDEPPLRPSWQLENV